MFLARNSLLVTVMSVVVRRLFSWLLYSGCFFFSRFLPSRFFSVL